VQLARLAGAHVTAVADSARADFVRDLGARVVVDRRRDDVLAGGQQRDIVLDAPGALRFAAVRPSLAGDGVLVSTRPLSPDTVRGLRPGGGPRPTAVATRRSPVDLARLVDTGRLRVPRDRVVALEDVVSALEHAGSGQLRRQGGGLGGRPTLTAPTAVHRTPSPPRWEGRNRVEEGRQDRCSGCGGPGGGRRRPG
jgi:NADPH:quinone reductase-like Zn-dependent oxidoreductase